MLNCKSIATAFALIFCAALNLAHAEFLPGEFITYSQDSWGGDPGVAGSGAQLLLYYFDLVFPNGTVQIGLPGDAGYSIVFSSPVAVLDFLPGSGGPGPLTSDLTDPFSSSAGVFAGYTLALQLDLDFADAGLLGGSAGTRFEDLVLHDLVAPYPQDLNGTTVREVVTELNFLLGGGIGPHSIDDIGVLTDRLSRAFEGGVPSQFAQDHLRIVPEPPSVALAILATMIVLIARRRQIPRDTKVRSCRRPRLNVAFILLIAALLPAASARGSRFISAQATAAMTYEGGFIFSNSASDSAPLSEERIVAGSAFQINGGTASFIINPSAGAGGVFGQSAPVTFNNFKFNRLGSQVDAYMQFSDSFTIDGPITNNNGAGLINVNFSGVLLPNSDFESQYAAAYGNAPITASVTFAMTTGQLDEQGDFVSGGSTPPPIGVIGEAGHPAFNRSAHDEFFFDNEHRTIGVEFTIGGLAEMGGGFSLQGSGGVTPQASTADGSLAASSSSLEESFFEIEIELPPGYSIHGHSVFMRQVTIPEPTTLALVGIGVGWVGAVSRRRTRGNIVIARN